MPVSDPVEEVVDVTIAYKGKRDFCLTDLFFGTYQDTDVYMNFRTFKLADVPQGSLDYVIILICNIYWCLQLGDYYFEKCIFWALLISMQLRFRTFKIYGNS